jgi:hypothetical protein
MLSPRKPKISRSVLMSGMKKIAGAIALTSLILWGGAVSTVAKVFAQSQTTGGFEFGKFYTLLASPGKLSDCIIRVKTAYTKDEIEFREPLKNPLKSI